MIIRNSKLDKIINAILLAQQLNSNGKKITVYVTHDNGLSHFAPDELCDIFEKLERDEKIFKIVYSSHPATLGFGWDNFCGTPSFKIILKDTFDTWIKTYMNQTTDLATLQKSRIIPSLKTQVTEPEHLLKISYTKGREIVLNDIFLIGKPDFDGENDSVFDYLYKNPNKKFTKKEIEISIGRTVQKTTHKIIENLGFKGDLKKVFFNISKDSIQFKNPVTKKETGVDYIRLG